MGDILLGIVFTLVVAGVGGLVLLTIAGLVTDLEVDAAGDVIETPIAVLALGLVLQQLAQGLWPVLVARWKGSGVVRDFKFRFEWIDLPIGLGVGLGALMLAGFASQFVAELLGIDPQDASNTDFLTDADGSNWKFVLLVAVVLGAPLAEELFFRGLCLQAIAKRLGATAGLVGSVVLFTLPHFVGGNLRETATTFTAIAVVGLILGLMVTITDRLGPSIVAHMTFNGVVSIFLFLDGDASALGVTMLNCILPGR